PPRCRRALDRAARAPVRRGGGGARARARAHAGRGSSGAAGPRLNAMMRRCGAAPRHRHDHPSVAPCRPIFFSACSLPSRPMIRGLKLSRKQRVAAIALALVVVALGLGAWLRSGRLVPDGVDGETVAVARRPFAATVTAVGAIKPQIGAEVRVGSRISGRVERLRANIGDRVEKGQVIAELETAELDARVAQRRAELRVAESRLAAVRSLA